MVKANDPNYFSYFGLDFTARPLYFYDPLPDLYIFKIMFFYLVFNQATFHRRIWEHLKYKYWMNNRDWFTDWITRWKLKIFSYFYLYDVTVAEKLVMDFKLVFTYCFIDTDTDWLQFRIRNGIDQISLRVILETLFLLLLLLFYRIYCKFAIMF